MMGRMWICWLIIGLAAFFQSLQAGTEKDDKMQPKRNEALRQELLKMVEEDQEIRTKIVETPTSGEATLRRMTEIDRKNTARMKEIIAKHGWPGKRLVGEDGANAAWLLVQHADKDREFQKRCLKLLERAVKAREATAGELAYLTDRVLVGENKKQIYGTQFRTVDGKLEPYPIEDEDNVDKRRKEIGLSPMAAYRKKVEEAYKPKSK